MFARAARIPPPSSAAMSIDSPHGFLFTALLISASVLAIVRQAPPLVCALSLALLALHLLFARHDLAPLAYPLSIAPAYRLVGAIPRPPGASLADPWLASVDRSLGLVQPLHAPAWLLAALVVAYWAFFPLLFAALARFSRKDNPDGAAFYRGLFTIYALGYLGYLLLPAVGPYVHAPAPADAGALVRASEAFMRFATNGVDAFPSLHVAVSAFIGGFYWRHDRRAFVRWFPVFALIPFATVLLRFHYLVDVAAGFALAALGLAVARRAPASSIWSPQHHE